MDDELQQINSGIRGNIKKDGNELTPFSIIDYREFSHGRSQQTWGE